MTVSAPTYKNHRYPIEIVAHEVVVRINGQKCWLWRAVDQDGYVLDEIVQTRRNTKAAKRLLT
ncbi:DDE-type integrase/transposase/recombinase, partial [Rhizobium mongolense]